MFQVAIIPNNTTANMSLSYKNADDAVKAHAAIHDLKNRNSIDAVLLKDDFGYVISIAGRDIAYALFVDIEQSQFVLFEKDMAMNRANEKIAEKLKDMGFSPQQQPQKSRIIQH